MHDVDVTRPTSSVEGLLTNNLRSCHIEFIQTAHHLAPPYIRCGWCWLFVVRCDADVNLVDRAFP